MRMPEKMNVVEPSPYYEVNFRCSNRSFYEVKDDLWALFEKSELDEDLWNNLTDKCDYEGDLERIIIYTSSDMDKFIDLICEAYSIDREIAKKYNLHFVC